jgi:VWFA-related protein
MVVTVLPGARGNRPDNLTPGDFNVTLDKAPAPIAHLQRLTGELADMQLFLLLDDSSRSGSLSTHLAELKTFLNALPPTTQVALGYMSNGTFALSQDFTADHQKAAAALRLPLAQPGVNGSPYFSLSELVKRWPSNQATGRRAVLMLTDGVDRYYGSADLDDPHMDEAIHGALKRGVMVYSIYLSGAGRYGQRGAPLAFGQSHLIEIGEETGGYAYFEDFRDPVDITPFLNDMRDRLDNQYQVIFGAVNEKGFVAAKLQPESKGLKVSGPTRAYLP